MFLYTVIEALVAVVAGILLAACAKKTEDVTYTKLDKAGRITNIVLTLVYVCLSPLYLFLGSIARPRYDGFLGILGWIVAIVMASAALFCGIGLGLSVLLRKRGKSKQSFAVQFAGVAGIGLNLLLFFIFYGNLLRPLNERKEKRQMKKILVFALVLCLLLTGCATTQPRTETAKTISPLPDTTMDNLTDAILSVSLEKGDAYVDDTGKLQMDLKIYTYDKYDMVDIATLAVGDTIVTHAGEVKVTSKEQNEAGTIYINGGLEAGGFDLVTDDTGIFFETGYDDIKNWYQVGETTIRVSADFKGIDNADPDRGEVPLYPGDFLNDAIENYHFTPHNTTVRVAEGQIVEMHRRYVP